MMRPTLEVAIGTVHDGLLAVRAGADRLELCTDLAAHGFTADPADLQRLAGGPGVPVVAMLRPREPGFAPGPCAFCAMLADAEALLAAGASGIAFGLLTDGARIDAPRVRELVARCAGRDAVFHRAFDLLPDPPAAAAQLADLGVRRVLSAGQAPPEARRDLLGEVAGGPPSPPEARAARLRALVAQGAVEVVACGGIRAANAAGLLRGTGCRQVHSAARRDGRFDAAEVRALRAALDALP